MRCGGWILRWRGWSGWVWESVGVGAGRRRRVEAGASEISSGSRRIGGSALVRLVILLAMLPLGRLWWSVVVPRTTSESISTTAIAWYFPLRRVGEGLSNSSFQSLSSTLLSPPLATSTKGPP